MRRFSCWLFRFLLILSLPTFGQQNPPKLKIFISVDMEGIGGVVHSDQTSASGSEYGRARRLMVEEVNAAIDGALEAGASEILVNDSHGSMRNILLEDLRPPAQLISNFFKPMGMMQGLDQTCNAVFFIGYHAKAGSPVGVLAHTGSSAIVDLKINGISVGEGGMNIFAAGALGVPVVLVSGDQEAVAQTKQLINNIEGVAVKEAIGTNAAKFIQPQEARKLIRDGARQVLRRLNEFKPYRLSSPFKFEITFSTTAHADIAEQIPTVTRQDARTISYTTPDYLQGYRLLRVLYRYLRAD
jgi:D-amino peptidase